MKYFLNIIIFVALLGGIYAYSRYTEAPALPQQPEAQTQDSGALSARVHYSENGFFPREITLKKGESVQWINDSGEDMWIGADLHPEHTEYDNTTLNMHCGAGVIPSFDECGSVQKGGKWSFVFDKAGMWKYHNHMHSEFSGRVMVVE